VAASGIFIWGYTQEIWGTEVFQGRSLGRRSGDQVPPKLEQFADIVYRFWLQTRSKFENFAQITC